MLRVVAAALSAAAAAAESNRTASRLGRLQDIDDWLSNASGGPASGPAAALEGSVAGRRLRQ